MRHLLILLLLAASAFAQTATISDTIRTPFGGTFSGTVTVTLNSPALAQPLYSGSITLSGWTQAVTVTAGVFTLTLYTNDLITPGGTSYTATYAPTSGSGWKETWIVPTGATTIREIRSTTVPSPSVRFTPSQITQAGATLGQGLKWDGSKWAPADVVANPMTTNGDLITRLGGVPVRVGIGSTNQVLTVAGGMPVWATGITGNASTASALAANGTNCSAGSYPLGVDASGNAESCTAAVTASTGLSDSAALVRNNQANAYTAGSKQTFASNATTAGAAFGGGITADPSSVAAGDFWYRADLGTFGFRNASAVDALVAGGRALTTVGAVPFVTASGVLGQDGGLNWVVAANVKTLTLTDGSSQGEAGNFFVNWNGGQPKFRIGRTLNALPSMQFFTAAGAESFYILNAGPWRIWDSGSNGLAFGTNNTERARFAATTGNLLLGTTNDANFRLNVGSSGSSGTAQFYDATATIGNTVVVVRNGPGQTTDPVRLLDVSGVSVLAKFDSGGNLFANQVLDNANAGRISSFGIAVASNRLFGFSSTTSSGGSPDLSLSRASANTLQVGDGGANSNGTILARIHTWANGTEGTCDATLRGQVVMVQGGAGVADTFRICRKDAANAYAWTALY